MMKTLIGVQVSSDNPMKIIKIPLTCNLYWNECFSSLNHLPDIFQNPVMMILLKLAQNPFKPWNPIPLIHLQ